MKSHKPVILVVDDEPNMAWLFEQSFAGFFTIRGATNRDEALAALGRFDVELVMLDLQIPGSDGLSVLKEIRSRFPGMPVIMMTAYATIKTAVEAIKAGAYDYVLKPFDLEELRLTMEKAMEFAGLKREVEALRKQLGFAPQDGQMLTASPKMHEVLRLVEKVANTDLAVLIQGESGTGKELVARAVHNQSSRKEAAFVPVNCAALPENLLESELFGYEKGAFTGAQSRKPGRFQLADRGTLFLDEIGDMPVALQGKLLRVLEGKTVEPLGSTRPVPVDVRIIAASNKDLRQMVKAGGFREDLYFRLAVLPIAVPPLRERPEDVELLANHFLRGLSVKHGREFRGFSAGAMAILKGYPWPGNVRELKNIVEQIVVLFDGQLILPDYLPQHLWEEQGGISPGARFAEGKALKKEIETVKARLEGERIRAALEMFEGNRTKAAKYLQISRRSLQLKIKALGLDKAQKFSHTAK
ncbi:MAG: sigma-54 dependent transcriptional regulator [Firmicutes bacterium]|nr:sigma-54 dependent transcriptional regulator [Bacillota bacterium]